MQQKRIGVAYLIWLFLGGFGIHRFYLRQTTTAIIMLVIGLGALLIHGAVSTVLFYAIGLWVIVDAFLIPGMVRRANGGGFQAAPVAPAGAAGVPTASMPMAADDGVFIPPEIPSDAADAGDFGDDISD